MNMCDLIMVAMVMLLTEFDPKVLHLHVGWWVIICFKVFGALWDSIYGVFTASDFRSFFISNILVFYMTTGFIISNLHVTCIS
jgi:hypothetical protein